MTTCAAVLYAIGAGLVISVLDYTALVTVPKKQRLATFSDRPYLVKFFGHPLIGGFLAFVIVGSGIELTPITASVAGAGGPQIWRALLRSSVGIAKTLLKELSGAENSQ